MASEIIGLGPCIQCGATVEYKMNVAGRAFYRCNGSADKERRACGLEVKAFGATDTDEIVSTLRKESGNAVKVQRESGKPKGSPKPEPKREPEAGTGSERGRGLADELIGG